MSGPYPKHRRTIHYMVEWGPGGMLTWTKARCTLCGMHGPKLRSKKDEQFNTTEVRACDAVQHIGNCGLIIAAQLATRHAR